MVAAMGLEHTSQLCPELMVKRVTESYVQTFAEIYPHYELNAFINRTAPERFQALWDMATPDTFTPPIPVMVR
jgi:hypothetical protein